MLFQRSCNIESIDEGLFAERHEGLLLKPHLSHRRSCWVNLTLARLLSINRNGESCSSNRLAHHNKGHSISLTPKDFIMNKNCHLSQGNE